MELGRPARGVTSLETVAARISAIVHATEDIDRVLQALRRMFPGGSVSSKPETRRLYGHYGNEIRVIDLSIRGALARSFLEQLWKNLPNCDRASVLRGLDKHLDSSGGLHLRVDKEEVFRGILKLKDQDPIKIQLSFLTRTKSDLGRNEAIRQLLESLENSLGNSTHLSEIVS